ncbi:Oidioi.mRNA.OKI2018_I69.PAR.g11706.t1.cds [Oikopleura dioica]|uniref:ATP-dependent RNA helicase n=1 Tax=Oikopleura dioica TaxID=34765 RepID=A0ABN7S095_OIKDI|nr:Oidioi.mRNA.OKI2018_I69.PAR.g11706.t1.cds [Oikopleura dioica]
MIDLNLDFDDEIKLPSQSRKNSQQKNKNRKELLLAKRKKQKAQYERKKAKATKLLEKHGMIKKPSTTTNKKPFNSQSSSDKSTVPDSSSDKQALKRKPEQKSSESRFKKKKLLEADKDQNYVRKFDGKFSNMQSLARNLFDEDADEIELPAQRTVHREDLFNNIVGFDSLKIHPHLVGNLTTIFKLQSPTLVQQKSIPQILEGGDTLIRSQTGSGKTLAYMLPIFDKLMKMENLDRKSGVMAVIVVPTRELVGQTYKAAVQLTRACTKIVACELTGGQNRNSEKARLRKGSHILISTPGRLIDHLEKTGCLKKMPALEMLVLDEADRMLEMGYMEKIKHVIMLLKERKLEETKLQNVLLSATLSENVESLAGLALDDPKRIVLDENEGGNEKFAIPNTLQMRVVVIPPKLRLICLASAILEKKKTLVFVNTMAEVNFLFEIFSKIGFPRKMKMLTHRLHGNMEQKERVENMNSFLKAERAVLIATDVASRGLDLPNVETIVQFSPPGSAREYVQRVGRTARKGDTGQSLLFLLPTEVGFLSAVAAVGAGQWDQSDVEDILKVVFSNKKNSEQQMREEAAAFQNEIEEYISQNDSLRELAIEGYCSFIRSYAAYPSELKPIFHIKKLHLGHIAKSFGIRDKPTDFLTGRDDLKWAQKREDAGAVIDQATKDKAKERKEKRKKIVETKMKDLILSEFAA